MSAADFSGLDILAIFSAPCGKTSEGERNKKVTTSSLHPPPTGILFCHKKTWKISIFIYQTDRRLSSTLKSHTPFIGVSQKPGRPAPRLSSRQGRKVILPPRDDQAYTPTQSSRESPASSRAEASKAGSSDLELTAQSIQPLFLSLRSVGLTSPLLPIACCFMPAL